MEDTVDKNSPSKSTQPSGAGVTHRAIQISTQPSGAGVTHRASTDDRDVMVSKSGSDDKNVSKTGFDDKNVDESDSFTTKRAQPSGENDNRPAIQYANSSNIALHLMKPSGETGRASSPVRSAIDLSVQMQNVHTTQRKKHLGFAEVKINGPTPSTFIVSRLHTNSAQHRFISIDKSTPTTDGAETRLVASAVANEGKGATALTDVTSAQNQIAVSVSCALPPDDKMPDKADCTDQSVSRLGLALDAKDEGKGRTYMAPEPDNADSALHPVVEKINNVKS
jgi:hypothetical protein